nr:flagellar motor protein MotB [Tissierella pigra]
MDNVLFDSGSAEIKGESMEILKTVAELLKQEEFSNRQIKVEGHTDSDQIVKVSKYPTNWELSSARATNVLRYLVEVENIEGNRISSSGYSFYRGVAPNDTPENKARNRRVDIVILNDISTEQEPQ